MKRLLTLLLTILQANGFAQLANMPAVPSWLDGQDAYERHFEQTDPLLMAVLFVAADREVIVTVNGTLLGTASDPATAKSLDITRLLRQGANTISLHAKDSAPVRIATLLELNGDLASKRWLASDATWIAPGGPAVLAGSAADSFDLKKTFDAYNSWQLAKRDAQSAATDPASFTLPPGFRAELIRSAQPEEDSWVAMTFDPQGRITLAREKRGLLQFDPRDGSMSVLDDTLLECRGLLYAHGVLYAHANNSKALYRLGAPCGAQEILRTEGGVGHGRNHLKLGPDDRLWLINGNNVLLPKGLAETSPLRGYAPDQVLRNPWDASMFDGNVELPAGHVLRLGLDGQPVELFAGGLRNPLDLAFNRDGELFTFDADMERDVGASWYMPTRVLHVVPGADFGWRRGTGRFPDWYADTLPSVVKIGLSSPTAIFFGYGAKMPSRYTEALFLCDWSYGRILAVHLEPDGASYRGTQETFLSGRPLNVTDGCIGPDGALWFITGGRSTQSGLYRVSYTGEIDQPPALRNEPLRNLRRQLEASPGDLDLALANLGHPDRFIRHAARLTLERFPVDVWRGPVLSSTEPWKMITGNLALARSGEIPDATLMALPWSTLNEDQQLALLRVVGVSLARSGDPDEPRRAALLAWLEPLYPAPSFPLNQELCRLLVRLKSPVVLARTLPLIEKARSSEELVFYPLHLRYLQTGWDAGTRRIVFAALLRAESFNGASTYFKAIQDLRSEYAAATPPAQASELASIIHPQKPVPLSPHALPGHTFRTWKLADLAPKLDQVSRGRSFERGKAAAISTQCVFCHRMSPAPDLPAGIFGPELIQVSARFGRRDLLDHILDPSKFVDEKYRFIALTLSDGSQAAGSLESEDDERIVLKPNPLAAETVGVGKSQVTRREVSTVSPMPAGLLNTLKEEQVLDLLAFIESGGNPQAANFQP